MPIMTDNIDGGSTVTIVYDRVHSFTLDIQADTCEDFDPNSGYWATHSFEYTVVKNIKTSSQTKLDKSGGKGSLKKNNTTVEAEIPAGGVTGPGDVGDRRQNRTHHARPTRLLAQPGEIRQVLCLLLPGLQIHTFHPRKAP